MESHKESVALCLANRIITEIGANRGRRWTCYAQVLCDYFEGGNGWAADNVYAHWRKLGLDVEELRTMAIRDIALTVLPIEEAGDKNDSKAGSQRKPKVAARRRELLKLYWDGTTKNELIVDKLHQKGFDATSSKVTDDLRFLRETGLID